MINKEWGNEELASFEVFKKDLEKEYIIELKYRLERALSALDDGDLETTYRLTQGVALIIEQNEEAFTYILLRDQPQEKKPLKFTTGDKN